jgi:hypothetical protein
VVKKEGRPSTVGATAATMKESKSDSSFFSAPKQKPKLPSFKKAPGGTTPPTIIKKELAANVAQPSSTDAFQEALKDMARARRPSPAAPAPSTSSNAEAVLSAASANTKLLKKKKSVTWAPDGQLELVKLIERAVYDDDPVDVSLLFLLIIVQYINYVSLVLIYRVRHTHCTMYVNWKEGREPLCMPTYSRSFLIGLSHNVSIAQIGAKRSRTDTASYQPSTFRKRLKRARGEKVAKNVVPKSSANLPLSVHLISFNQYLIRPRIYRPTPCFPWSKWTKT